MSFIIYESLNLAHQVFFQWQYPRAFLDRITLWQIAFSKDGRNYCSNKLFFQSDLDHLPIEL